MKFNFSNDQTVAVYKLTRMMAESDGVVVHKEIQGIDDEMLKLGVKQDELDALVKASESMLEIDALLIISKMDDFQKKYVASFLGYFISIDDDINDTELALWTFIKIVARLPKMNIRQAIDIYKHI